ncbi:hypothetical protein Vadar_024593 [Vaccinium darrowii]|uniref:Uncharacterized protein n=1 Tax=Vaccinium darrowii TaxID=229202 RepID=A0ACB7YAB2_9ERIC|nr:hypothetical protein Vadar_024593 [Vaccinium darrowii]
MSELPSEVRLVRCPKCENLLPELKDYSFYKCGGCGTILRAKNEILVADTLSQKSDEERVRGGSDKFPENLDNSSFPEKGRSLSDGPENNAKSNGSYTRRAGKRVISGNTADNQSNGSSSSFDSWAGGVGVVDNDHEAPSKLNELNHVAMGKQFEELKPPNGSLKSAGIAEWRSAEGGENEGFRRNPIRDFHDVRYSTPVYSEDGPYLRSSYGYGEAAKNNQNKADEFRKAEYLGQDKAELLRKLDELKDQLSRSCDVNDKPKEKFPLDRRWVHNEEPYGGFEPQYPDGSWGSNGRPHYVRHYPEPLPYMFRQEMEMQCLYPSMHAPNQVQRFEYPLRSQVPRRGPHQAPAALQQQSSHAYFSGQYIDTDMDPSEPYPPNMNFHHPSCSCFHCYSQQQVPAPVQPDAFHNRMFPNAPNNLMFPNAPSAFGSRDGNLKTGHPPPLTSNNFQSDARWPFDQNSEAGGFVHRRPSRMVLATHGRRCRPIAGGAPFFTCYNCLELLQLPKKILLMDINQKKVRCGGCSTVILVAVVDKKLVFGCTEIERTSKIVDDSSNAMATGGTLHSRIQASQARTTFSSDDYDNSGYDFEAMDREVVSSSMGKRLSANKFGEMASIHSTSPYSSEDVGKMDTLFAQVEESNCIEPVAESSLSPPASGSPLRDHFQYSNRYHLVNRFGKGSPSGRSEREKVEDPKKVISRKNSVNDVSLATEIDVSLNEYQNSGISQESGDTIREDQLKAGRSFFGSITTKSFKDSSESNQTIEISSTNVTVNGHPMSDRLLKKAEKLSGPIQPGHYWYDSRAGFWGVMGGPCLGIIPPFIEEFDYPIPKNCAGGNTSVFVNGRELHQKDLSLLFTRGLPTARDRSYIIEINGRVLDEDSGEELDSLGKLAPTVEKAKRGFGMRVPRVAA